MTPHAELLQAKIAEVLRRADAEAQNDITVPRGVIGRISPAPAAIARHAFDVERDWTPPVDPDLLLAREIAVWRLMDVAPAAEVDLIVAGRGDEWEAVVQPLAIIRAHRAKQALRGRP